MDDTSVDLLVEEYEPWFNFLKCVSIYPLLAVQLPLIREELKKYHASVTTNHIIERYGRVLFTKLTFNTPADKTLFSLKFSE
jgi:hypothetical protein